MTDRPARPIYGAIALTTDERIKAERFGEEHWLYIVDNCRDAPTLHLIQDPASKHAPKEETSVVRYMVDQNDWKSASEEDVS